MRHYFSWLSSFIMHFKGNMINLMILQCFLGSFLSTSTTLASFKVCITDTNGPQGYNDEKDICCDNRVSNRLAGQICCGNEIIDSQELICCGGKPHPRFAVSLIDGREKEQSCCSLNLIFHNESLCCGGIPVKLTKEQSFNRNYLKCCGKGIIANTLHEECCGEKVLSYESNVRCCGEEVYNTNSHWCEYILGEKVVLQVDQAKCNDKIYTVTEKKCCYGVLNHTVPERDPLDIRKLNEKATCCETKVIDPTQEACCWERETKYKTHSIPKRPTFKCCGDSYFDTSCEDCSDGKPIPKRGWQKACGSSIINMYEEDCCANYLRFNKTTQQCCRGTLSSVIPKNQKCCNGAGYTDKELCCENTKPCPKGKEDDDDCCFNQITNEGRTFKTGIQKCYRGHVFNVPPNREVCGWEHYNPETHFCCEGLGGSYSRLADKTSGYNQCCGSTPFNNHTQTCCFDKVYEIPAKNASCCFINHKAYTYHDTSSPCTQRCSGGTSHYDIVKETCCDGSVYKYRRNFDCCGSFYFKSKGLKKYGRSRANRRWPYDCCGNKDIFSRKTSVCRNGEIQPKIEGLTDTQVVCYRPMWRSVDDVAKYACESQYALKGKLRKVIIRRKAIPNLTILEMTLSRLSFLPIQGNDGRLDVPRKLTIQVEVPMNSTIKCSQRLGNSRKKVAVFFSAPLQGRTVIIKTGDRFRIVDYRVLRKMRRYGMREGFCSKSYSPSFLSSSEQVQLS